MKIGHLHLSVVKSEYVRALYLIAYEVVSAMAPPNIGTRNGTHYST